MDNETKLSWCRSLIVELLAYGLLAASFLWAYVVRYGEPSEVVHRHLALLATSLILLLGLRALGWRYFNYRHIARGAATFLMVTPWVLLLAWYVLVLIGLDAWGRVPTWPLIKIYAVQATALLDVLGITPWLPGVGLLLMVLVLVALVWRYLAPHDWIHRLVGLGSAAGSSVIIVGFMTLAALMLHMQVQGWAIHPREPIALGFMHSAPSMQSHIFSGSHALDAREEAARRHYQSAATHAGRNLVVIVGDALRATHMTMYGYARDTTPELAARAQAVDSAVISPVRSVCAESSCGLMALAASRPVAGIGSAPLMLQEVLRRHGYAVHFILGGDHTNFYGLKDMYGKLDSFHDGSGQNLRYINDDQLVLDRVKELPSATPGQPVAFHFHLMSTHGLGQRDPAMSPFQPAENYYRWPGSHPKRQPSDEAAYRAVNYYDNGVVRFDHMVSRILDQLQSKGYLDDALVVVTGDHGELLGEQGLFSHKYGLSEPALDIPLVLLRHGYVGEPIPASPLTSQIDVAPTVLRELGLPVPEIWQGRALQDPWTAREIHIQQARYFGVYHLGEDGRVLKYVRDLDSGAESVTDPVGDPKGLMDLSNRVPAETLNGWRSQSMVGMLNSAISEE